MIVTAGVAHVVSDNGRRVGGRQSVRDDRERPLSQQILVDFSLLDCEQIGVQQVVQAVVIAAAMSLSAKAASTL